MCGIIYHKSFKGKPINSKIIQRYEAQKNRGQDGFGLFDVEHQKMPRHPSERHILRWLKNKPSSEILFHHRFPTSTDNVKNACHPFSTYDFFGENQYILVHNGILSNAEALYQDHLNLGIKYSSMQPLGDFNDSEALLWDIALYLEGKQAELKCRGSIAFICLKQSPNGNKLFFGRNVGSPLMMNFSKKRLALASTGTGQVVLTDNLYEFDYKTGKLTHKKLEIPESFYTYSGQWGGESFMTPASNDEDFGVGSDGQLLIPDTSDLSSKIKDKVKEFLELNNGYFSLAYEMMEEAKMDLKKQPYTFQNMEDIEILNGAQEVLLADSYWVDLEPDVQDPFYASDMTRQNRLLPSKGEA